MSAFKVLNKPKAPNKAATERAGIARSGTTSTHRCCAERRLLDAWVNEARRHGVPPHKVVAWVRRKLGPEVLVLRYRADGTLGCAAPCIMCARELVRFDLRVHCPDAHGRWFSGRLDESGAPPAVLTSGQRRMLNQGYRRPHTAQQEEPTRARHALRAGPGSSSQHEGRLTATSTAEGMVAAAGAPARRRRASTPPCSNRRQNVSVVAM